MATNYLYKGKCKFSKERLLGSHRAIDHRGTMRKAPLSITTLYEFNAELTAIMQSIIY